MPLKKGLATLFSSKKSSSDVLSTTSIDANFIEHHPDAVYTLDLTGVTTSLNEKTTLLLGYTKQDLLRHKNHFIHPDDHSIANEHFQEVLQGKSVNYIVRVRHASGHYLEMLIANIPIFDQGLIVGAYGIARDITQTRHLKSKVESITFDHQLVESLPGIATATFNQAGYLLRFSQSFGELLGISDRQLDRFDKKSILRLIHPDNIDAFQAYLDILRFQQTTDPLEIETRVLHSQDGYQDVFCRCAYRNPEDGDNAEITCAIYNLSDHKQLNQQLHDERHKLSTFQQVATSAIYRFNLTDKKIDFSTQGFENLFNGLLSEYKSRPIEWLQEIVVPEDQTKLESAHARILSGHDVEIAYRIRIEHTLFWILEHRTPLRDEMDHVIAYQSVVQDITQLKHQEERIFQLAMHDPVTGLPNRALVLEQLQHWIDTYECFSVFTVSYNLLRSINHDFGYKIGDRWLTQTATRLLHHLSKETYVGHLYGDEYIVLLPHLVSESDIEHVCETFLRSSKEKIAVDSYEWYPSMTIGVSRYPEDASQPDELIKAANIALGRAKTNSYSVYSSTYNIETYRRHQLQNSLRTAIRRDELFLEYQPKVNAWSGIIVGAEALVRWQHPEWGRIPPNDFIPLSEESDMHILIADWVLEETCRSINQWVLAGLPAVPVSINVSPKRLMYGNFAETVKETLRRFDISPGMLEIEILETDVLFDNAKIHQSLEMLSAMGIRIALDDFGKGYSSISYLQQYPIDTIKIDRQFATSLAHDKKTQSVVRSVLFMANEFGMDVIAEGVETMEQLHYLRQLDCTTIQGYLFSRPLPKADFESALKERQVSAVEAMSVTAHQLTVTASITIHRLKGKQIHVGYTDILISKGTLHSVSFYSSLHLPIHEEIELALKINDHIIIIQPNQSFELENGLTEYECRFMNMKESHYVFEAMQRLNHI